MTNSDVRQTIEWVFKVRDEVTGPVKAIQRTAEEGIASAGMLTDTQDRAASSAEALRATLTRLKAQAGEDTSETSKGVQEASTALDGLMRRQRELRTEQEALQRVLDESLSMPEPDLSKVRDAVAEAERLAGVRVVMPAPDATAVTEAVEDARKEASEPISISNIDSNAVTEAVDRAKAEASQPISISNVDTTAVDDAVGKARGEVQGLASTPISISNVDMTAAEKAVEKAKGLASTPISISNVDSSAVDKAVADAKAEAAQPVSISNADSSAVGDAVAEAREAASAPITIQNVDSSAVDRAVKEAQDLASTPVVIAKPDISGVQEAQREVDIASLSMQDAMSYLGELLGEPIPVAGPDTSEVDATMDAVRREVSAPMSVQAPDTAAVDEAVAHVEESVRRAQGLASTPITVAVPDTTEADAALAGFREAVTVPQTVPAPETAPAMAEVEAVRQAVMAAGGQIQGELDLIADQMDAMLADYGVSTDAFLAELDAGMEEAVDSSRQASLEITASQTQAQTSVSSTNASLDSQRIKMTAQLASIGALKAGVAGVIGGITSLGLVSDETAASLGKVNAAFSIMAGAAGTIKAIQGAMSALNVATAINASLNSFNAVLQNPAMLAGVGLAAGAALGVAGAYLVTQNNNSSQTTINIVDGSEGRVQTGGEIYDIINGSAL